MTRKYEAGSICHFLKIWPARTSVSAVFVDLLEKQKLPNRFQYPVTTGKLTPPPPGVWEFKKKSGGKGGDLENPPPFKTPFFFFPQKLALR